MLLLESDRPVVNAASFGSGFLLVYSIMAVAAFLGGAGTGAQDDHSTKAWVSVAVGVLFLLL